MVHITPSVIGAASSCRKRLAVSPRCLRLLQDITELLAHQVPEIGQARTVSITPEQQATQLVFKFLNGAGQCRLTHRTAFGRAIEIERVAHREEILDLVHLHWHDSRTACTNASCRMFSERDARPASR
jgi:hypothetical protein